MAAVISKLIPANPVKSVKMAPVVAPPAKAKNAVPMAVEEAAEPAQAVPPAKMENVSAIINARN